MRYYLVVYTIKAPEVKKPIRLVGMRVNDMASMSMATRLAKHWSAVVKEELEEVIVYTEISGQDYEKLKF